jgi:peptidoglycan hydrolase CwlO-like protein
MKLFTKLFTQGEMKSNEAQANKTTQENINKNLELIHDNKFDLNGILGDFDAKINFLYEKMSKMEKMIKKKDEEIHELKEQVVKRNQIMNQETSIHNDSETSKMKNRESVRRYHFYIKYLFFNSFIKN